VYGSCGCDVDEAGETVNLDMVYYLSAGRAFAGRQHMKLVTDSCDLLVGVCSWMDGWRSSSLARKRPRA